MKSDITLRNGFFDAVCFEHVEVADIDEASDVGFGLAARGLAIDVAVSDGCDTSVNFFIKDRLKQV